MTTIKTIKLDASKQHGTALQDKGGAVWICVAPKPWDIATWLWWWLAPADKKSWVILNTTQGQQVRTKALRVANRLVSVRHTIAATDLDA